MKKTLTALILTLWGLVLMSVIPDVDVLLSARRVGPPVQEWSQTTLAQFARGQADGVELTNEAGGEIRLDPSSGFGIYTSPAHGVSRPFDAVGSRWSAEVPPSSNLTIEVRASEDGGTWSDWTELLLDADATLEAGEESVGGLVFVSPSRAVQYRVLLSTTDRAKIPFLDEITLFLISTQPGPTIEEAQATIQTAAEVTEGVPRPKIISRAGWGAREDLVTLVPQIEPMEKIIIHHTATRTFAEDPAAGVRAVFYYHAVTQGWGDIGYNYLVDVYGNIYEGRKGGDGVVGSHALQFNHGSIGIALLGDFSTAEVPPEMERALTELVSWLSDRFGIDPRGISEFHDVELPNILGHRDVLYTTCPGRLAYDRLISYRETTWQKLLGHDPRLELVCPGDGGVLVESPATIEATTSSPSVERIGLYLDDALVAEVQGRTLTWEWDLAEAADGEHVLRAIAYGAGDRSTEKTCTIVTDLTPPVGTVSAGDEGGFVNQASVVLTFAMEDPVSGVASMRFSEDGETYTAWEPFAETWEWNLSAGEGERQLFVQFQDAAGNTSESYAVSLYVDLAPPDGWSEDLAIESGLASVVVEDPESGLDPDTASYARSGEDGEPQEWQPADLSGNPVGQHPITSLVLAAPSGEGYLQFRIQDRAGNESVSPLYEVSAPVPDEPTETPTDPTLTPTPDPSPTPTPTPTPEPDGTGQPDLVVQEISVWPSRPRVGESLRFSVMVVNAGDGPAEEGFWVRLFLDPEPAEATGQGQHAGQAGPAAVTPHGMFWWVPTLAAGETAILTYDQADPERGAFPDTLPAGTHRFFARADVFVADDGSAGSEEDLGRVAESDEGNNLYGPLTIEVTDQESSYEELLQWLRRLLEAIARWLVQLGIELPGVTA